MSRVPLTVAALARSRPLFDTYQRLVSPEFQSLTSIEVAEAAFSRMLKPNPYTAFDIPNAPDSDDVLMLGTDQRDYFVPLVREEARHLTDGDAVFDIGCGDGQTTAKAFETVRCKPAANILDPNAASIANYKKRMDTGMMPLRKGQSFVDSIDRFIDRSTAERSVRSLFGRHALCLVLHSIYFTADVSRLMNFVLDCLRPGGRALVVFGDDKTGYTGTLAHMYDQERDPPEAGDRRRNIQRRFDVFGIGDGPITAERATDAMRKELERSDFRVLNAQHHESRLYGNDLGDILALSFISGLVQMEDSTLADKLAFVGEALFRHPERFDLALETDGIRAHMLSVQQPQYYFCIERTEVRDDKG